MDVQPVTISSEQRFAGRIFTVRQDRVRMANGRESTLDIVEHRGSFGIAACPSPDRIVLVRQYRHAIGESLWEIPAGMAEIGETPTDGALRELAEETGYRAGRIRQISSFYATPGFCNERVFLFLAADLTSGEQALDPDEAIEFATFPLSQARAMAASGEIADAKTLLALCLLASLPH
jgi:ADP-ribose pyrophosphatase